MTSLPAAVHQVAISERRHEPATCIVIDIDGLGALNEAVDEIANTWRPDDPEYRADVYRQIMMQFSYGYFAFFHADAEHPEVPHREIQIQHVTDLARMGGILGASVVRIFTAYAHPSFAAHTLVETLREAAARSSSIISSFVLPLRWRAMESSRRMFLRFMTSL